MKVLWFTGSPSLTSKKLNRSTVGQSWIEALEIFIPTEENID